MQNYGGGSAAAEFDPKAFLHWQPRDVIIAPLNSMVTAKGGERSAASCCSEPNADGLTEFGRLATTAAYGGVNRLSGHWRYRLYALGQPPQAHSLETHREVDKLLL
jgi:hypothetical protein